MFKKLHKYNVTNKQVPTQSRSKSKSNLKKSVSYSALQKKKQNNSDLYDYDIANFQDHIYQGCFLNNKKHGEGSIMLNSGIFMIGRWENGLLEGYALFITPLAGKVHAHCKGGKLDGWVILEYQNNFEIFNFTNDTKGSIRRRYDKAENVWTEASYSKKGKLYKVLRIEKCKDLQLPSFVRDYTLIQFYTSVIENSTPKMNLSKINITTINDKFYYYGYTDLYLTPCGLGAIYSNDEIYAGNFKNGELDKYGLILFEGGVIYKGEIETGKILGNGAIYDFNMDETKFVMIDEDGDEHVDSKSYGFHLSKVPFKIGQTSKILPDTGFSVSINELCEEISKYFFKTSSSQSSIHIEDDSLDLYISPFLIEYRYKSSINYEKTSPKMEKIVPKLLPKDKVLPFRHESETVKKEYQSFLPSFPSANPKILFSPQEKRIPNVYTQIGNSFGEVIKLIPIAEAGENRKILYPSLLYFNRSKEVGVGGLVNAGKIVSNMVLRKRKEDNIAKV